MLTNFFNGDNHYQMATRTRIFVSFDFDNDKSLKNLFVGQSRREATPFNVADFSVKEAITTGNWKREVRDKIARVEQVVVICGEHTDKARGVSAEIDIARKLGKPYFLLKGRSGKACKKPKSAKTRDKIYPWTWKNINLLLKGKR